MLTLFVRVVNVAVAAGGILGGAYAIAFRPLLPGAGLPPWAVLPQQALTVAMGALCVVVCTVVAWDSLWSVETTDRGIARALGPLRVEVPWSAGLRVDRTIGGFVRIRGGGRTIRIAPTYPDAERIEAIARDHVRTSESPSPEPTTAARLLPYGLGLAATTVLGLALYPAFGALGLAIAGGIAAGSGLALLGIAATGTSVAVGGGRIIVRRGLRTRVFRPDELRGYLPGVFVVTLVPKVGPPIRALPPLLLSVGPYPLVASAILRRAGIPRLKRADLERRRGGRRSSRASRT